MADEGTRVSMYLHNDTLAKILKIIDSEMLAHQINWIVNVIYILKLRF